MTAEDEITPPDPNLAPDDPETPSEPAPEPAKPKKLRFKVVLRSEEVEIEDKDGVARTYVCRELTGDERDAYLNQLAKLGPKYDANGRMTENRNFEGHQANLIVRCLHTPDGKKLHVSAIQKWPSGVQEALFDLCQKINSATKEAADEAKKELPAS